VDLADGSVNPGRHNARALCPLVRPLLSVKTECQKRLLRRLRLL